MLLTHLRSGLVDADGAENENNASDEDQDDNDVKQKTDYVRRLTQPLTEIISNL